HTIFSRDWSSDVCSSDLDRDYISNSLLLENSEDKIKGVEASFGKGGVDIELKIKELEKLIIKEDELGNLEIDIAKLRKEIRVEVDKIHDRRKDRKSVV